MSEISSCTLIQDNPNRKVEAYLSMFKTYPDMVSVQTLQEMLGICRKTPTSLCSRIRFVLRVWGVTIKSRNSAL